eukprot:scaffold55717_cov63-Cyclotella_meneghiniana.AAC.1
MTSAALTFGSALLAFSPSLSILFFLVFPKPQLLILAICSAFAYLLAALFSSALWWIFRWIPGSSNGGWGYWLSIVLPSIASQYVVRCAFVTMYFRVERVIQKSVAKHEAETAAESNTGSEEAQQQQHAETNALQLQMNDMSCALASGAGYAFMHSLFLYGTLLASEAGEQYSNTAGTRDGTLYQPSCSLLPSLINGALVSGMFSILDVIWMCCTFYGMRRKGMYSNDGNNTVGQSIREGMTFLKGLPDSSKGGNAALGLIVVTHVSASLAMAPNMNEEGCRISLPLLGGIVVMSGILFTRGVKNHYLPQDQRRRIDELGGGDHVVGNEHHID